MTARRQSRPLGRSLRVSPSFRDYVVDQLAELPDVRARAMFGGVGLYGRGLFFGIIAGDVLYLKVDHSTRARYERTGMKPFRPYPDRSGTMQYYEVPTGVLESAVELVRWAREAVKVAERAQRPRPRGSRAQIAKSAGRRFAK